MGTFFLLLSKIDNINNLKLNLQNNQQVFLTAYDIHDTMMHFIYRKGDINELKKLFSVNDKGNSMYLELMKMKDIVENMMFGNIYNFVFVMNSKIYT